MSIFDWLFNSKLKADEAAFSEGFDWAAGVMLRASDTLSGELEINSRVFESFEHGPFDRGAIEALRAWYDRR